MHAIHGRTCALQPSGDLDHERQLDASPSDSRRVLFYSHDGTGLGHLRITLGVATAYAALRPQDSLLLLTGSLQAGAFHCPRTSTSSKSRPCRSGSCTPRCRRPRAIPAPTTARFAFAPLWRWRPCRRLIPIWSSSTMPRPVFFGSSRRRSTGYGRQSEGRPLALLMRDITFGAQQTRTIWTNEGIYPLLDDVYDRILVYGDRRVFDPDSRRTACQNAAAAQNAILRLSRAAAAAPLAGGGPAGTSARADRRWSSSPSAAAPTADHSLRAYLAGLR